MCSLVRSFIISILQSRVADIAKFKAKLLETVELMFAEYQEAEAATLLQELFHRMEEKEADMESDAEVVEEMLVEHATPTNPKGAGRKPKRFSDVRSQKTVRSRFLTLDDLICEGISITHYLLLVLRVVDDPELVLAWHLANISDHDRTLIALGTCVLIPELSHC